MRVLILDPFHGAAGDMVTGALLDCGADRTMVVRAMESAVAEPVITHVTRAGTGHSRSTLRQRRLTGRWTM